MLNTLAIGLCGALVVAAGSAHAEGGDAKAGRAFAQETCTKCHAIGSDGKAISPNKAAPTFRSVAGMSTTTPLGLRVFLSTPHPTMPNLILSKTEMDNVIAYILSLRAEAPNPS